MKILSVILFDCVLIEPNFRITLPLRYNMKFDETIDDLMLKPGVRIIDKKKMENLDYEVGPYKYENPNDSLYCSQQQVSKTD